MSMNEVLWLFANMKIAVYQGLRNIQVDGLLTDIVQALSDE